MSKKKKIIIIITVTIIVICLSSLWIFRGKISSYFSKNNNITNTNQNNNTQNTVVDTSEKVAKLYRSPNNKFDNKEYIKEISKNEIEKIQNIFQRNEQVLARVSLAESPDYIIELNDEEKSYGFRMRNDYIDAIENYSIPYVIYKENDVKDLLQILNAKLKDNFTYTEIDINKTYIPLKLYINGMQEATLGSNIWKDEKGNVVATDMKKDINELLKDKEPIASFVGPTISTNSDAASSNPTKLPATAKISYAIYNGDNVIIEREAERMMNGSYHMSQPNISAEYIYIVTLTFTDSPDISATYYFKYKI